MYIYVYIYLSTYAYIHMKIHTVSGTPSMTSERVTKMPDLSAPSFTGSRSEPAHIANITYSILHTHMYRYLYGYGFVHRFE